MPVDISIPDLTALCLFLVAWCGYTLIMDHLASRLSDRFGGVNHHLKLLRGEWMRRMLERENRIMDTALVGHTIHSVTFFASTSMLILAGLVGLLGSVEAAHGMLSQFSFASPVTREFFELKILLLFGIFIFGFLKFTWAIRQYNYCCAMMGSAPIAPLAPDDLDAYAKEIGHVLTLAGASFNGGLRAYYFALAALTWFVGPYPFMFATLWVILVLLRRQFVSRTYHAMRRHAEKLEDRGGR
ncbi:membrane protein [Skermanella stibiiresistens SB22]|uniref:Membrane protein n=1 Tax=Skermanella stibiiresistens SB22 TaxID=1385369 RepID=W9GY12_9PROT|nr:DUF599 domain-containing protein [Skermanella stibiiresistens]EWY37511.1 membrane protein [Skermanella stibiiresistens SB22]